MELFDALMLARLQFAFTISFHIIFPAFTIGLASYLAVLEALWLADRPRRLSRRLQLLEEDLRRHLRHGRRVRHRHELPVRHQLERVLRQDRPGARPADGLRGADRLLPRGGLPRRHAVRHEARRPRPALLRHADGRASARCISAFWILSANSWMQTPAGYAINAAGQFMPVDWWAVIFNPSFPYRLVHMVLAAYLTTAFVVGARRRLPPAARRAQRGRARDVLDGDVDGGPRRADPDRRRRPARPQHAASTSRPRSPPWRAIARRAAARR